MSQPILVMLPHLSRFIFFRSMRLRLIHVANVMPRCQPQSCTESVYIGNKALSLDDSPIQP